MKYRRFEILIACILTVICYFGNYYLKEPLIAGVANHTSEWYTLNILWLISMVLLGYWGLIGHEYKWVKKVWLIANFTFLIMLLINKLTGHIWHRPILPEATSTLIRTPFFFLMVAFLPRWFKRYKV